MDREAVCELLGEDTIMFDGLDGAIVGHGQSWGNCEAVLIYSYQKMVEIFMAEDGGHGMDYEEACEWIDFNIVCLHAGPHTPIILLDIPIN